MADILDIIKGQIVAEFPAAPSTSVDSLALQIYGTLIQSQGKQTVENYNMTVPAMATEMKNKINNGYKVEQVVGAKFDLLSVSTPTQAIVIYSKP